MVEIKNMIVDLLDKDIKDRKYPSVTLSRMLVLSFIRANFWGRHKGNFKYDIDDNLTEIIIKDSWTRQDTARMKQPSIIVSRGPTAPMELGYNNGMNYFNPGTDTSKHMDILITGITTTCLAGTIGLSEYLANEVYNVLRYFKRELMQRGVADIRNYRIDPPRPNEYFEQESKITAFQTEVQCQLYMYDWWGLRWKTEAEVSEYKERTGVDVTAYNFPPKTLEDINVVLE